MAKYIPLQKHREEYRRYHRYDLLWRTIAFIGIIGWIVLTVIILGAVFDGV